jgi:GNAT superfamily N-acetyltransferase
MTFIAAQLLDDTQEVKNFDSGVAALDDWLKRRARTNQQSGASRTYVICEAKHIVAYYALASGSVAIAAVSGRVRRNMPDPVPIAVLGRLAIAKTHQRRGLGRALLQDASKRILRAAEIIGIRCIVTHAISTEAKAFYLAMGFVASPLQPLTLMATLADLKASL